MQVCPQTPPPSSAAPEGADVLLDENSAASTVGPLVLPNWGVLVSVCGLGTQAHPPSKLKPPGPPKNALKILFASKSAEQIEKQRRHKKVKKLEASEEELKRDPFSNGSPKLSQIISLASFPQTSPTRGDPTT